MDEVVVGSAAVAVAVVEPSVAAADGVLVVAGLPPAGDDAADDAGSVPDEAVDVAVDGSPPAAEVGVGVVAVPLGEVGEVGIDVVGSPGAEVGVVVVSPLPGKDVGVGAAPDPVPVGELLPEGDVPVGDAPVGPDVAELPVGPDAVEVLLPGPVVAGWPLPVLVVVVEGAEPPKLLVELSDVGAVVGVGPADGTPLNGDGWLGRGLEVPGTCVVERGRGLGVVAEPPT